MGVCAMLDLVLFMGSLVVTLCSTCAYLNGYGEQRVGGPHAGALSATFFLYVSSGFRKLRLDAGQTGLRLGEAFFEGQERRAVRPTGSR